MTKMTKREAFKLAQEALSTIETVEADRAWTVIQNEIDRLERVALKAKTGETKADKAKAEFRQAVLEMVEAGTEPVRATDIAKAMDVSCQKATAALTRLVEDGILVRVMGEKRTVLFTMPSAIAE